ncbi:right-handed parallel beta-helix repeat-containing protein [Muriicola marianensis]|nr:right-handed parallel beta-helix repeat-containing protein [Muriicola marianensis]
MSKLQVTFPKTSVLLLFIIVLSFSCSDEDLFEETISQEIEENTTNTSVGEPLDPINEVPCTFDPTSLEANSTVIIDCTLDLNGSTINLPSNISLDFDGGEITNGTLNFSGGTIDGRLLNITLDVIGDVSLKEDNFFFDPARWEIVEGIVSEETALTNRENINSAIELVKSLGGTEFNIGRVDAYFNVKANKVNREYCAERSIRIPSNFHLKMSDETFLRVQPNNFPAYALITLYTTDNTTISGGNLFGDRFEHDYSPIVDIVGVRRDTHGYGHVIWVIGSHNTLIQNVTVKEAIGEGIQVHSKTIRNPDGSLSNGNRTSENVLIKDCFVSENRRNNIAVVDANGVVIDNCIIDKCGNGEQTRDANGDLVATSAGTAPRYGIDLEALRYVNNDGSINEINKVENVVIKNSRFTGNEQGDIVVYTANSVQIDNNYFDKWVANFASFDVEITNNVFEARSSDISFGINIQSYIRNNTEFNYNYVIRGNTIKGYEDGIKMAARDHLVENNTILDCEIGIQLTSDLYNTTFRNNTIRNSAGISYGYKNAPNADNINNISISGEDINVGNRPISFINFNAGSSSTEFQITFTGNTLNSFNNQNFNIYLDNTKNILFENNLSNTDFEIVQSQNIVLRNNEVNRSN